MQYTICVNYYSNAYYRVFNLNPCILTNLDLFPASAHEIVPATVHRWTNMRLMFNGRVNNPGMCFFMFYVLKFLFDISKQHFILAGDH